MKVALVKPPRLANPVRGVGFYTQRLLAALEDLGVDIQLIESSFNPMVYHGFDIVHFPFFDIYWPTFPPIRLKKTVVTFHDVIPLKFPQAAPAGLRGKAVWRFQRELLKTVDAVITDSETSKKDIAEMVNIPGPKIHVTYLASDPEFRQIKDKRFLKNIVQKYHLPEKFILYVGDVNWNKNIPTLVKAVQEVGVELVLVGKSFLAENVDFSNIENQPLKEVLSLIKNDSRIHRLGFVPTADLAGVYNLAKCYVQASVYEGFGLPVLEAMSCGTPVICGKHSSLVEIGGNAVTYADVENVDDLADKIIKVKPTGREIKQSSNFSWEKTAQETLKVYEKVLS